MDILQEIMTKAAKDGNTPIKEVTERTLKAFGNLPYGECESVLDEVWGTGFFTSVVANEANNRLVQGFGTIPQDWRKIISDIVTLEDLKQHRCTTFSGSPYFPEKAEYEGYETAKFVDRGETYTPKEYGRIFPISRKAKANDQIGAFQRWATEEGKAAGRSLNRFVFYNLLGGALATGLGETMSDSVACFNDASHSNLVGSWTATRDNVGALLVKLFAQTGDNGEQLFYNGPYYLVCSPANANYYKLLDICSDVVKVGGSTTTGEPNLFGPRGRLAVEVVPSPYVAVATDAYLIAGDAPTIELGFYEGKQTPTLTQEMSGTGFAFTHDQYRYKADMAFGGRTVEWRGMVMGDTT